MSKRSKKKSKSKLSLFIAIVFLAILFYGIYLLFLKNTSVNPSSNTNTTISNANEVKSETETPSEEVKETVPEDTSIKMTVMGDIMCHNSQYIDAYNSKTKKYNFDYVFEDVKDKLSNSDLTIGNLETTFAGAKIRI